MYTSVHSCVGTIIVGTTYILTKDETSTLLVGGALSFISHHYLDKLGEYPLSSKDRTVYEGLNFLQLLLLSFSLWDLWWIPIVGFITGNLMDMIDKKMYLIFFKDYILDYFVDKCSESKYTWWRRFLVPTKYFTCHNTKPLFQLNYSQTSIVSVYSCITMAIITLLSVIFK